MTQLAINGRFFGLQITGVERYAREVCLRLPRAAVRVIEPSKSLPGLRGILWEQTVLPRRLRRGETLLSLTNLGPVVKRHQVLVLHDVAVLDHPEWFSLGVRSMYRTLLPNLTKNVSVIVTDSDFSRQRIIERLHVREDRVVRIYPGWSSQFKQIGEPTKKTPYVLTYGSDDPRKNFSRLLEAWEMIAKKFPGFTLKVFGRPTGLFAHGRPTNGQNVEFLGFVPETELPSLYRNASLLVYPSLYEGFGLPVLEALASGTPVVLSDIAVFKELFDGYVTFVDPLDATSISAGIESSLGMADSRDGYVPLELLSRYNYDRTAEKLYAIATSI